MLLFGQSSSITPPDDIQLWQRLRNSTGNRKDGEDDDDEYHDRLPAKDVAELGQDDEEAWNVREGLPKHHVRRVMNQCT